MALKVMTIVGTRPELIKLSRVIAELDARLPHVLVHTGQNFDHELNKIFFEQLEIRKPNHFLEVAAETPAQAIANIIAKSDEVLEKEGPDALLRDRVCAAFGHRLRHPIPNRTAQSQTRQRPGQDPLGGGVHHCLAAWVSSTENSIRTVTQHSRGIPQNRLLPHLLALPQTCLSLFLKPVLMHLGTRR